MQKSIQLDREVSPTDASKSRLWRWAGAALLALLICVEHYPGLFGEFVVDDDVLITDNLFILTPEGLYQIWTSTDNPDYWPLTSTSFWLEWRVWKGDWLGPTLLKNEWFNQHVWGQAVGFRLTNLALHLAACLLLWSILNKLRIPGGYLAALLFAVHPVNVETVVWIAQRKNTLAMVFFLLSLSAYLNFDIRRKAFWYALSMAGFLLAMLAKGSVSILPLLILLALWWRRPLKFRDFLLMLPFFLIAVGLGVINVWFQKHGKVIVIRDASFMTRLAGAGGTVWFYLWKDVLPFNLAFFYPKWKSLNAADWRWWIPLLAAINVTGLLIWGWWTEKRWGKPLLFAWLFYCIALVPVLGFVDVGFMKFSLVSDHYQHIAIIAFVALLAALWSRWHAKAPDSALMTAFVVVGTLVSLSYLQSSYYSTREGMFRKALDDYPECQLLCNELGNHLAKTGRLDEAGRYYARALELDPDYVDGNNNWGAVLLEQRHIDKAMVHLKRAQVLDKDYLHSYVNVAKVYLKQGRVEDAIDTLKTVLKKKSYYGGALMLLGETLRTNGRAEEAVPYLQEALRLNPKNPLCLENMALAMYDLERWDEAIEYNELESKVAKKSLIPLYRIVEIYLMTKRPDKVFPYLDRAEEIVRQNNPQEDSPQDAMIPRFRGLALFSMGQNDEAIDWLKKSVEVDPNFVKARLDVIRLLLHADRIEEAIPHLQRYCELVPDDLSIRFDLARYLNQLGKKEEAAAQYQQILKQDPRSFEAYFILGKIAYEGGRVAEALDDVAKANVLAHEQDQSQHFDEIGQYLAKLQAEAGDTSQPSPEIVPVIPSQP